MTQCDSVWIQRSQVSCLILFCILSRPQLPPTISALFKLHLLQEEHHDKSSLFHILFFHLWVHIHPSVCRKGNICFSRKHCNCVCALPERGSTVFSRSVTLNDWEARFGVWSFKQVSSTVETICQLGVIYCIQTTKFPQPQPQLPCYRLHVCQCVCRLLHWGQPICWCKMSKIFHFLLQSVFALVLCFYWLFLSVL